MGSGTQSPLNEITDHPTTNNKYGLVQLRLSVTVTKQDALLLTQQLGENQKRTGHPSLLVFTKEKRRPVGALVTEL